RSAASTARTERSRRGTWVSPEAARHEMPRVPPLREATAHRVCRGLRSTTGQRSDHLLDVHPTPGSAAAEALCRLRQAGPLRLQRTGCGVLPPTPPWIGA